jgi:hypothetical protein
MRHHIVRTIAFAALSVGLAATASANEKDHYSCSIARVAGAWGYSLQGTIFPPTAPGPVPVAFVGTYTVDRTGYISGTQTSNAGGNVSQDVLTGTLTVNADCTGTQTVDIYNESGILLRTAVWAVVFLDNATEVRGTFESLVAWPSGVNVPAIAIAEGRRLAQNHDQDR